MPAALVWLRNDLRTHDHAPLADAARWAAERGGRVVPVYCVDPRHFGTTPHGFPKTGAHRARFLLEALADLRAGLRALGGDLVVRAGHPEDVLPALARELGAERGAEPGAAGDPIACFYHEEVASEETTVEAEVEAALRPLGVAVEGRWGHTLLHPDDLPFDLEALPDVFTKFRTAVEGRGHSRPGGGNAFRPGVGPRAATPAPDALPAPGVDPGALPTFASLGLEVPALDPRARVRLAGGEGPGLARLAAWTEGRLARYKSTRNGLLDPDDATRLSPWLAHGCVSPRAVYEAVLDYERRFGRTEETYWLVFELLWRDFFRFVAAKHGDRLFYATGLQGARVPFRSLLHRDEGAREDFERWRLGQTGVPLVDAAMRELLATGYTSNRTRQNVASFLVKNLGVDWRAGAEWFESVIVDYDVASNWGNWAYVAGVGNDARGFRFFNVYKQAEEYDPEGAYVRHWLPELAGVPGARVHRPERLTAGERDSAGLVLGRDYPEPMVDLFESAARQERLWARAAGRSAGQAAGRGDRRLEGRRGRDPRGRDGRARRR